MIPATMPRPAPPAKRNSSSRTITSKSSATPSSSSLSWSVAPPKVVGLDMPPPSTHVPLNQSSSSWIDHHSSTPPESLSLSMSNAAPNHEHHHISRMSVAGSSVGEPAPSNNESSQASKSSVDAKPEQTRLEKGKHTTPSTRRARGNGLVHPEHDQSPTPGAPDSGSSQASWDSRAIGRSAPGAVAPEDGLRPSSSTSALSSLAAGHLSPMDSFPFADSISKTLNDPDTIASKLRRGASVSDLGTRTRAELEMMLQGADQLIRAKEQELTVFHAAGEGLLQEYQSLRSRHDALISGNTASSTTSSSESASPAKASTSRPTSSRTSSGTSSNTPFGWSPRQLALGFGVPPSSAVRPSFQTSERPHYYPRSPPPPWSAGELDIDPSRPERADSDSSSLCSPPRSSYRGTNQSNLKSPMRARDVQALSQRNEALTLQLNELEVDSENADREGRKRLRKLEKELSELRQELDRVESVNESLKAQADIEAAGAHALKQSVREHKERYDARRADLGHERRQSAARRRRSSASDDEQNKPRDSKSTSLLLCNSSDGAGRRQIHPTPSPPEQNASLKLSPAERETLAKAQAQAQEAEEAQKAQDFVVQKLMDKIGELQETNDIITNERVEMEQRLREATVEVDEFKRRCEELEEIALMEGIDWKERRGIGWHENPLELGNVPAGRLKGNRRMIEKQRRREAGQWRAVSGMSQSASSRSVSSSISLSQSPTASKTKGKYPPVHRTLDSELGTDLDDLPTFDVEPTSEVQSSNLFDDIDAGAVPFEQHLTDDSNNSDYDVGDDAEEELTNGSSHETSRATPQLHLQHPSNRTIGQFGDPYYSPPEDTSRPLVPRGFLRYSGPPENADYDNLERAASELPAAWEDEGYGRDPPAPHRLGRVGGRLLEWVEGGNDEFADEEKFWSRYPEEEEDIDPQMARLESREDVEAKSLHSLSSSLLRRRHRRSAKHRTRAGSLKSSRVVSSRFRDVFDQREPTDEEERLTRRQVALRRMGLEEDIEYSEEGSQCDDYDSGDDESIMTDYEVLDRRARQGDYYPVSLRARYAPKMVIARITDQAMQHLVELVTYLRFFALLAMAVTFALWQGPKRALGPQPRRRRIQ